MGKLIALLYWTFIFVSAPLFFCLNIIAWFLTIAFDRRLAVLHWMTSFWARTYLFTSPFWKGLVLDRDKWDNKKAYVVVSNHQSQLDIMISFCVFKHFKWVSKREMFWVPCVGWTMFLNRYIGLRRGNLSSVRQMYNDCIKAIESGSSVFLFPEGTRSKDGEVSDFKGGAFAIAKRAKVPVLLIAISGTAEALPKNKMLMMGKHTLKIKVLGEIPVEEVEALSEKELATMARERIIEGVSELDQIN